MVLLFVRVRYSRQVILDSFTDVRNGDENNEIDQLIKVFCETIKSSADYHALAWYFPKETRDLKDQKKRYIYPGIAMLVKNIDFE